MPGITRQWITTDGQRRSKTYNQIGGTDVSEYRRQKNKKYYEKHKLARPRPHKPIKQRKTTKSEALSADVVQKMKEYRALGLSFAQIGRLCGGLSDYVVQQSIALR